MKNVFESTYDELDCKGELYECDGGAPAGGISGGDMTTGTPTGPAGGITSDSVLGPSGEFEKGHGCLGKGDFHIPFPVMPMLFRYGKDCCNGGGSKKKRKGKGGKTVSVKNPYAKGMKTIVAEGENGVTAYSGRAKAEFDKVVSSAQQIYTGVLNYNDALKLAWMVREDGGLRMYKPMFAGRYWTVYATTLQEDGTILLDYKGGMYKDENSALTAVYREAEKHKKALEECLAGLNESSEEFFKIGDIVGFLSDGKLPWRKVWKFQRLSAREAVPGERVRTVGSDGNVETERSASAGDWIVSNVSNPDNEWIIDGKTFAKKYEPSGKEGVYRPKGGEMLACPVSARCRTGIEFAPPNRGGDVIRIASDGYFMKDPSNPSDIYAISKKDFDATYSDKRPVLESAIGEIAYAANGLPYIKAGMKKLTEASVPVVSDQTIDAFSAKYYCVFADKGFQKDVEEIKTSPEFRKTADEIIRQQLDEVRNGVGREGEKRLDEFLLPAALAYPVIAPAVKIVGGMVVAWFASKLAADAVVSATKDVGAAASAEAAGVTAEAIKSTPVYELDPVTVEAPRIDPEGEGGGKGGFWKWFLATSFGGALSTAGHFLATLFGLGTEAAAGITMGLASAIAVGCAALAKHMLPVMVSWFRKMRETGVIASVEFDSDKDRYRMSYSIRDNKWRMYLAGSRLFSRRANPSAQEAQQAMQTEFFRKFRERCSETLHRYLDDPVNAAVIAAMVQQNAKDPDMKYALELLRKKDEVLARFD